jgi:hypothetical protein
LQIVGKSPIRDREEEGTCLTFERGKDRKDGQVAEGAVEMCREGKGSVVV